MGLAVELVHAGIKKTTLEIIAVSNASLNSLSDSALNMKDEFEYHLLFETFSLSQKMYPSLL
jgi:hypothetical protein